MEAPEAVPVREERLVVDGEQRATERREHGELVVGPLYRGQRRPQGAHLLAVVKRSAADQQMPDAARFERVDVGTRHVGAPTVESAKQHGDVPRLDGNTLRRCTLRGRPRRPLGHRPPAVAHHPVDECTDGVGKGCLDGPAGHAAPETVRTGDRQRHHGRLRRLVLAVGGQRDVAGARRGRCRVLGRAHQRRERAVDQALDGGHGTEARGEGDARHAAPAELLGHLPVDPDVGAPEAIDRLLGVSDQEELAGPGRHLAPVTLIGIARRQQQQDLGLQRIGVLELVDEDARVALLRVAADAVMVVDQVPRLQQQIDEVEAPRLDLQPVVALDGIAQLHLQVRRQVGVRHLREALQHVHHLRVPVQDLGPGDAAAVLGAGPPPRFREVPVRGQLDELRLDAVVVAPARPDGVGRPNRLHESAGRLRAEKQAVAPAVGGLVRQLGELFEVGHHLVDDGLAREALAAPGPGEIAPFRKLPGGAAQPVGRPRFRGRRLLEPERRGPPAQRPADARRLVVEGALQPCLEGLPEDPLGRPGRRGPRSADRLPPRPAARAAGPRRTRGWC